MTKATPRWNLGVKYANQANNVTYKAWLLEKHIILACTVRSGGPQSENVQNANFEKFTHKLNYCQINKVFCQIIHCLRGKKSNIARFIEDHNVLLLSN